jgi:hypothetical protein
MKMKNQRQVKNHTKEIGFTILILHFETPILNGISGGVLHTRSAQPPKKSHF